MFGASSRSINRPNADGSSNVYCSNCRDYIGASQQRITRALCAICLASEESKPIPEDALLSYRISKGLKSDVSALNIPDTSPTKTLKRKIFSFGSLAGEVFAALGRFAASEKTVTQQEVNSALTSVKIARDKRRPRLFSNVSLGQEDKPVIGSMSGVDKIKE